MTAPFSRWETVKAKRRAVDPGFDDPARLAKARADLNAYEIGYHLGQMRETSGKTQAELAEELHVAVEQVTRMEQGDAELMDVPSIAAYVAAVGGHLRLVADLGRTTTTLVDYTEAAPSAAQRDVA